MPFDQDSGLVFTEKIVSVQECSHPDKHHTRFRKAVKYGDHGARSLMDMAKTTLFRNMKDLDKTSLEGLPLSVVERLWTWMSRSSSATLHAWQLFADTGHFDKNFVKRVELRCMRPQCLASFASSTDIAWLTDLTIGFVAMDTQASLSISEVPNLRSLDVQYCRPDRGRSPFTDRIIGAWAHDASERGALSRLELLFINDEPAITMHTLQHLHRFPALSTFAVRNCGINHDGLSVLRKEIVSEAQALGWNAKSP
jgi:hypothetical protein